LSLADGLNQLIQLTKLNRLIKFINIDKNLKIQSSILHQKGLEK